MVCFAEVGHEVICEYFSDEVYNAGADSQRINATYYYLRDLIESNDVKTVILGKDYHLEYSLYEMQAN